MNIRNMLKMLYLGTTLGISCVPEVSGTDNPIVSGELDSGIDGNDKNKRKFPKFNQDEACIVPPITPQIPPFIDTTRDRGLEQFIQSFSHGGFILFGGPGVAVGDVNGDDYDDLYFPAERTSGGGKLFINSRRGNFREIGNSPRGPELGTGAMFFDYDNDGDQDLLVIGIKEEQRTEGLVLYENNGAGNFTDITKKVGMSELPIGARFSAAICDIENDGDLDVIVAGYTDDKEVVWNGSLEELLYVNNSEKIGRRFTEEANERGLNQRVFSDLRGATYVILCIDINRDGSPDILVGNDNGINVPNELYINNGTGSFTNQAVLYRIDYSSNQENFPRDAADTMGIDIGDINLDGIPDIIMSNYEGRTTLVFQGYLEREDIRFRETAREIGIRNTSRTNWGVRFVDPDNDMDLDVMISSSGSTGGSETAEEQYWRNNGWTEDNKGDLSTYREFSPVSDRQILRAPSYGLALTDLELDGRVDVVIANSDSLPNILSARPTNGNWVLYKLTGTVSNRDAVGSIVRITARDGCTIERYRHNSGGFASSDSAYIHSGLGPAEYAETTVIWPTGETEEFGELEANHAYELVESSGEARIIK